MVRTSVIAMMILGVIFSFAFPIFLAVNFKRKYKASMKAFWTGCGVWLLFALILKSLFNYSVQHIEGLMQFIDNNIWAMALYGGLTAAIFEEIGRFTGMKLWLKEHHDNNHNSLMYGAGHGGIEAVMILGIGMMNNIVTSFLVNAGEIESLIETLPSEQAKAAFNLNIQQLIDANPAVFLAGDMERISAILLHISLSVLVWLAVVNGKKKMFPLALFIHFFVDAVMAYIAYAMQVNTVVVEIIIFAMSVIAAFVAWKCWKAYGLSDKMNNSLK